MIGIPRAALRPVLVAWPTLTRSMARVVTERRVQLGSAKEWEIAQLSEVCVCPGNKGLSPNDLFVVDNVCS